MVAGGAGYIGSHVNKQLNESGYRTVVVDNLSTGHEEFARWGAFYRCDVGDADRLRTVFREHDIAAVMHFCAYACSGESVGDPQKYYVNNVSNALALLGVMREHGVRHFIFSSSAAIFGDPADVPIREDHPMRPINPYGRSKLMVEQIMEDYSRAYDFRSVALRYFNAAGADPGGGLGEWHEPETHLIPLVLDAALGIREEVRVYGDDYDTADGTCVRDYIHVSDLASAHIAALEYLERSGGSDAFNLGNGNGYSVREVIEASRAVTGSAIPAVVAPRRPGDPATLIADTARARSALGWRPRRASIEGIIETAWRWHRKLRESSAGH